MQKVWGILTLFYHFLMRRDWKRIQKAPLMPWQAIGMITLLWIALELCFQFWIFGQKMQSWYLVSGAASRFYALGLPSVYVWECFRVKIQAKKSMFWWIKYLIFNEIFSIFFMPFWYQSWPNLSILVMHKILRFYGDNMLQ